MVAADLQRPAAVTQLKVLGDQIGTIHVLTKEGTLSEDLFLDVRDRLVPINRKYPLAELIEACRRYPLGERERLTFEYVMLEDVNDSNAQAAELVRLLSGIRAKINLIPHNPAPELPYKSSSMERIVEFQTVLTEAGLPSFIRRPRGQDISAACGQLAARHQASA